MTFTTTKLSGDRVLVRGQDRSGRDGETVLSSVEWDEAKRHQAHNKAVEDFDTQVEEFFKPITDAAEKLELVLQRNADEDSNAFIVLNEGSEGEAPTERVVIRLGHDAQVLRLIEEGKVDRLIWVGDDLEIVAPAPASAPVVPDPANAGQLG